MSASSGLIAWGASPQDWRHFSQVLELSSELLPVVSNPRATVSPNSALQALGKVPSIYNHQRQVIGFSSWPRHQASDADIAKWSAEPDYGIAMQCRRVRAIDVDIADEALAVRVQERLQAILGKLPCRARSNSSKFLLAFILDGDFSKRVIHTAGGAIEFLANGQQFIAIGTHPSGTRYDWRGGIPQEIPSITAGQFERAWNCLIAEFSESQVTLPSRRLRKQEPDLNIPDPIAEFLVAEALALDGRADGKLVIACPWDEEHTGGEAGDGSTVYFRAGTNGYQRGHFKCLHAHCEHRTDDDFLSAIGYESAEFDEVNEPGLNGPIDQFHAFLPEHRYIHRPTQSLWPAISVDRSVRDSVDGLKPSVWLDHHRPIHQMIWCPGEGEVIADFLLLDGVRVKREGQRAYNTYRSPETFMGEASRAERWRDHLRRIYPEEVQATHIERWLAHRVQFPGVKINHALVLGGSQGIGKDTLLEPVKRAVGAQNWADVAPTDLLAQFTPWVKSVVLRVNETRNLGESDRFAFYENSKMLIAAPPDVLTCNEKHKPQVAVVNVMGVIYTTNNKTDGIYLPNDDRRHFVVWSGCVKEDFTPDYWSSFWFWLVEEEGWKDVGAFLKELDLKGFDPKAPPPKTEAFYAIVMANQDPRDAELASVIEELGHPDSLTLRDITAVLDGRDGIDQGDLRHAISDGRGKRQVPFLMERAGYVQARNPDAKDHLWRVSGQRQAIYCRKALDTKAQISAARARASGRG